MNGHDERVVGFARNDPSTLLGYTPTSEPIIDECVPVAGELLVDRSHSRVRLAFGLAVGFAAGLLVAVALIPDQPDRVLVPVEAPAGFVPSPSGEWSA